MYWKVKFYKWYYFDGKLIFFKLKIDYVVKFYLNKVDSCVKGNVSYYYWYFDIRFEFRFKIFWRWDVREIFVGGVEVKGKEY